MVTMREIFAQTLVELGQVNDKLVVLDADVSSSTQTAIFGKKYPERFYNFGIAEANMVSAAAGMATMGLTPVASTFAFLLSLRAGEQVRSLIAYNNLHVVLAGGYAGLSDFADGASHQSVMDLAVMRAMPNLQVLVPSDIETTRAAVKAAVEAQGPIYIRLSRHTVESLHKGSDEFQIGKASNLKNGSDVTLAVCGTLLTQALEAAKILEQDNISAEVLEFSTLKPFDNKTLLASAEKTGYVISIEEHNIIGGLGSAVAECLSQHSNAYMHRIGLPDCFGESARSYDALLEKKGLHTKSIVEKIKEILIIKYRFA